MAKHPARRFRDDGRPTEPGITLQFRNVEHYQEWMHTKGIAKAVQVIEGVSASSPEEKYLALRDALVEASVDPEFNGTQAIVAMRKFFNLKGE